MFSTLIWWIVIIFFFLGSLIGLLFPIISSTLFLWVGFLIYHFALSSEQLGVFFWGSMIALTIVLFFADILANSYFVRKFGGSVWGERSAVIGIVIGSFVIPPFGIFIVPLVLVFIVELLQGRPFFVAMKVAVGSFIGFFSGTIAKIVIQIIMIIWFLIVVIF